MDDVFFECGQAYLWLKERFLPVPVRDDVHWDDLHHLEAQQEALQRNAHAWLNGLGHHQVLLWGARGTGKSSLVRALFLKHRRQCALLQVMLPQIEDLPFLLWRLGQEALPFMLYLDDVSFQADEPYYRSLKSTLDGAIMGIPRNVMLLMSSNRRHLLHAVRHDEALHPEDERDETGSLVERFGLRLAFHPLSQDEYLSIIHHGLGDLTEALRRQALQFALKQGSRSGRVAQQFIQEYRQRCAYTPVL